MKTAYILLICLLGFCISKNLRLNEELNYGKMSTFDKVGFWVTQICSMVNDAKRFLSYTDVTTIKGYQKYYGFDNLVINGKVRVSEGVPEDRWETYKQSLMKMYEIPAKLQKNFDALNKLDQVQGETSLHKTEAYYDSKSQDEKYIRMYTFMYSHTDLDDVNAISSVIEVKFEVAHDVMYMNHAKAILGGAWSTEKEYFEERPRGIEEKDLVNLIYIIKLIGYRSFGREVGIDVDISDLLKQLSNK